MAVVPSGEVFRETRGYELWTLNVHTLELERFAYGVERVGIRAVGDGERVFAVQAGTQDIFLARVPSPR